jgi:hypothetical protein
VAAIFFRFEEVEECFVFDVFFEAPESEKAIEFAVFSYTRLELDEIDIL